MKMKIIAILSIIAALLFVLVSGCRGGENDAQEIETMPDYSYVIGIGESYICKSGEFVIDREDPGSELIRYAVFKRQEDGGFDLFFVPWLTAPKNFFWEGEAFYVVTENGVLIEYDLSAEDPAAAPDSTELFPDVISVIVDNLEKHDSEFVYVTARLFDEEEMRHGEPRSYAVRRNGGGFSEEGFSEEGLSSAQLSIDPYPEWIYLSENHHIPAKIFSPIDYDYNRCRMQESLIGDAARDFRGIWRDEMEYQYEKALSLMPEEFKERFIRQQTAWLEYEKNDVFNYIGAEIGYGYIREWNLVSMNRIRERTLEIMKVIFLLDGEAVEFVYNLGEARSMVCRG